MFNYQNCFHFCKLLVPGLELKSKIFDQIDFKMQLSFSCHSKTCLALSTPKVVVAKANLLHLR